MRFWFLFFPHARLQELWQHFVSACVSLYGSLGKTIDRYIILEILAPFITTLIFFVSLFISIALRESLGDLLSKGVPASIIFFFLLNVVVEQLPNIFPVLTLFAGLLATSRLSNDQELVAMRALGISPRRIYGNFVLLGLFLTLLMASVSFYWAPLQSRERRGLSEWLFKYHSLAFVSPGRFFNKIKGEGSHTDIYTQERSSSLLKNIYVHFWDIYAHPESSKIVIGEEEKSIGKSRTNKIIYAQKGELIKKAIIKKTQQKNDTLSSPSPRSEYPKLLQGRDLMDLGFQCQLGNWEEGDKEYKKYIRLHNGFAFNLNEERNKLEFTNFLDEGLMDYTLATPSSGQGYFTLTLHITTLGELVEIYNKMHTGGLVIDPNIIYSTNTSDPKNYMEIPRLDLIPILKDRAEELSNYDSETINERFHFYVPESMDTPEKRKEYFASTLELSKDLVKKYDALRFTIHKRISSSLSVLVFLLLAFPLGISVRRSGKGASFSFALLVYAGYSIFSGVANLNFENGNLPPVVAAWLAEFILLALTIFIVRKSRLLE